jgi:hypothetical protein
VGPSDRVGLAFDGGGVAEWGPNGERVHDPVEWLPGGLPVLCAGGGASR